MTKLPLNNNKKIINRCEHNVHFFKIKIPILSIYCIVGADINTRATEELLNEMTTYIFLRLEKEIGIQTQDTFRGPIDMSSKKLLHDVL